MDIDVLQSQYADEIDCMVRLLSASGVTVNRDIAASEINKAYRAIRRYLFLSDSDDLTKYSDAAVELAIVYYNNQLVLNNAIGGERSITQKVLSSRSITYASASVSLDSKGLTESVKAMLPLPRLKLF